jgi:hypothetical protein
VDVVEDISTWRECESVNGDDLSCLVVVVNARESDRRKSQSILEQSSVEIDSTETVQHQ